MKSTLTRGGGHHQNGRSLNQIAGFALRSAANERLLLIKPLSSHCVVARRRPHVWVSSLIKNLTRQAGCARIQNAVRSPYDAKFRPISRWQSGPNVLIYCTPDSTLIISVYRACGVLGTALLLAVRISRALGLRLVVGR